MYFMCSAVGVGNAGEFFSILGDEWEVGWEGYEKLEGG